MKKISKLLALLMSLAVCFSMTACTLFKPYEKPVDALVKAANSGKYEKLLKVLPKSYIEALSDEEIEDLKDSMDKAEEKISYKVTGKEKIEGDDLEAAEKTENTFFKIAKPDMEEMEFSKGYKLDVEFKMGDETTDAEITVYKIDGRWCFGLTSLMNLPSLSSMSK